MSDSKDREIIEDEDVDDVIAIASELAEKEQQADTRLDRGDVVEIGDELGIDAEHVEEAFEVLHDREEAAEEQSRNRAKIAIIAGSAVAALAMLALILAFVGRSGVRSAKSDVDKAKAQVRNVLDRQANVEERMAGAEHNADRDADRDAELAGAENRVSIEKRRYDEAASKYNDEAGSFPGSWGATVFGMSKHVPLSNEVDGW